MKHTVILVLAVAATIFLVESKHGCKIKRRSEFGNEREDDGYYCICNMTYCDEAPDVRRTFNPSKYFLITSSKSGLFFNVSSGVYKKFKKVDKSEPLGKITINQKDVYQEIQGFGGAVTDSAAMKIQELTHEMSEYLLGSYFGPHGINYNFIRTPMGGTDFSTRPYTYAMVENDTSLQHFDLQIEDYLYKIPIIKRAKELKKGEIKLLTAPWSASLWMKNKKSWMIDTKLRPQYRQLWANYFVKFFEAYRRNGLEFWATTPQNEPENYKYISQTNSTSINAMAWTAEEERDWIIYNLAPTLKKNNFGDIKILTMDDTRLSIPDWPKTVFEDRRARDIISGIAVHFYFDHFISPSVLNEIKELFPEQSILYTEGCAGVFEEQKVILGSWKRAELYAANIIETMSHWVSTWIDWNIALDMNGGPNWIKNFVDSPIIINSNANEFYKQPMFYAIGHFSKYVPPGSMRIGTTSKKTANIRNIAFSTPDGSIVLVILNLNEENKEILIHDPKKGTTKLNILAKSLITMKYW
ncbi:glucosylceramidase isoform X2 [Mycetomoellerius zeteki]|uniref:glucosylceramidase isoform X2 n=1 Tax=Mycetomoellerius zeteki TaxID=64791 RepID=UPI00084EAED0|nr:PREDICTED: glucosylceramidase-like isoform X2 [Trachymyrmex zeteki]